MRFLILNCGSSSLKFQVIEMPGEAAALKGIVDGVGQENSFISVERNGNQEKNNVAVSNQEEAVTLALEHLKACGIDPATIEAVGHRVVHGGEKYKSAAVVTEEVLNDIRNLCELAPLHNPANLAGIEASMRLLPRVPNAAVFDSSFHQTLPPKAYLYGLPYELYEKYKIRKYGFHGISHKYVCGEAGKILKENIKDFKVLSCHLGSGASICAVAQGKSVEISMGFTPWRAG